MADGQQGVIMANGELSRQIANITSARGWEVAGVLAAEMGERRVLVRGPSYPFDAVLSVRTEAAGRDDAVAREARARLGSHSEHIVGVLECVAAGGSGRAAHPPALLLEHAPGGTLARLLARGEGLPAHEAATVLVGVASGLSAMHAAGWAHTAVAPGAVVFRRDGCPALDGLAAARALDADSAERDRDGFQRLVEAVCASVASPVSWRMLTATSAALARHDWDAVVAGIVSVAEPGVLDPVRLRAAREEKSGHSRSTEGGSPIAAGDAIVPSRPMADGLLATILDGDPVTEVARRFRSVLHRRRRLVLVLSAPLVVAAAILAVVPPGGSPHTVEAGTGAVPASPSASSPSASRPSTSRPPASASPPASSDRPVRGDDPVRDDDPVRGDDPAAAASSLLEQRHRCFLATEHSPDCLADVFQRGAPVVSTEASALGTTGSAEARDFHGAELTLVERWGDAALVSCAPAAGATPETKPASFLLVRNEAGWRIRDVLSD